MNGKAGIGQWGKKEFRQDIRVIKIQVSREFFDKIEYKIKSKDYYRSIPEIGRELFSEWVKQG